MSYSAKIPLLFSRINDSKSQILARIYRPLHMLSLLSEHSPLRYEVLFMIFFRFPLKYHLVIEHPLPNIHILPPTCLKLLTYCSYICIINGISNQTNISLTLCTIHYSRNSFNPHNNTKSQFCYSHFTHGKLEAS